MEEVLHVPTGQLAVNGDLTHTVLVVLAKQLHAHHSEDEDDDGEDQRQVAQGAHGVPDDLDEGVERRPGSSELEDAQLRSDTEEDGICGSEPHKVFTP